jgi:hypothetical protein
MSDDDRPPWARRDDETDAQWMGFKKFRDVGLGRTIEEAWAEYARKRGLKSERAPSHFHEWKDENDWLERAAEWDRYQDRQYRADIEEARRDATRKLADRASNAALLLAAKATGRLKHFRKQLPNDIDIEDFDATQLNAIRDLLDRIGADAAKQLIVGGDVEHQHDHEHDHEGSIAGALEQEIVEAFADRYRQMDDRDVEKRAGELEAMEAEFDESLSQTDPTKADGIDDRDD